jgi:hypothetical protein
MQKKGLINPNIVSPPPVSDDTVVDDAKKTNI